MPDSLRVEDLLEDLTEAQRAAASHIDGAMLVLAGPGSGKTRVITRRVAHLIANGIPAWQILAVTFTNKAAGEMRERIDHLLPANVPGRRGLVVSTFHSLCARLLRRYAERAGLDPGFVIYDSADQRELVKAALKDAALDSTQFPPASIHGEISRAKNDLLDAPAYRAAARDYRSRNVARIYDAYEKALAENNAVDFDDLLLRTARLLVQDGEVCGELQERFRYLLIDEYQDTNRAQFTIAKAIAGGHGNLFVVGDPDQSIYGWRGADIRNILQFEEHFGDARIVALGENFRSTGHIVAAAASLIDNNLRRRRKELFTGLGEGELVRHFACLDEQSEADAVIAELRRREEQGTPWGAMAILYRLNSLSRVLEESLRRSGVPYTIVRGTAFFDRKEVRDALSYLRLLSNPADSVSLARVVNVPPRGLGDASLGRVEEWATANRVPLLEALRRADEIGGLSARAAAAATAFASMVDRWRADALATATSGAAGLSELVDLVLRESGMRDHYAKLAKRGGDDDGEDRTANLDELVSAAAEWQPGVEQDDATAIRPIATLLDGLAAWLESVALVSDSDAIDPSKGAVTLMTLHAAKGLEYDVVAMVGLEQGLLPHARSNGNDAELEEERRLCFVGMTRARKVLVLASARHRVNRGQSERTMPSQFLREVGAEHVHRIDLTTSRGSGGGLGGGGSHGRHGAGPLHAPGRPDDRGGHASLEGGADPAPDYDAGDDLSAWDDSGDAARRAGGRSARAGGLAVGCLVRHQAFGLGRVEAIMPRGSSSTARVIFDSVGPKNLVLEYAGLVRVG